MSYAACQVHPIDFVVCAQAELLRSLRPADFGSFRAFVRCRDMLAALLSCTLDGAAGAAAAQQPPAQQDARAATRQLRARRGHPSLRQTDRQKAWTPGV
jgi:hypothetical protein